MRNHLVAYFAEHHKIVEADALKLLLETPQPLLLSRRILEGLGPHEAVITRESVERVSGIWRTLDRRNLAHPAPAGEVPPVPSFELIHEGFSPATGEAPLLAYGKLFRSRFEALARLLRGRPDLANLRPIGEIRRTEGSASAIAMVRDVRQTSEKHHFIVRLEDASGALDALVLKDSPSARTAFLPDEVVGVRLQIARERERRLPLVEAAIRPDIPAVRSHRRPDRPSRVMFLSDLHIGSRSFLEGPWEALAEFLAGRGPRPELAREVEHVVIAGDLVDGIGIYPNQEKDLAIHDILDQYRALGRRLAELPSRLDVIIVPGNHDAVCPAEPQPALPEEIRTELPANVRSLGNPSTFALEGVVIEAYHGRSFDDLIPAIPGASYARPTEVMKRMLLMRHLAPIYGGRTPIAPLARDGLVVDPAPDILVTGHAHTFGVDRYRGVLLLNASAWQAETEYQRMRNISPVPAQAAIVDLRDLSLTQLDFTSGELLAPQVAA
ncbi:MAG TPA: DNA-directed DNA polymerase II small subunit [Thermoplasmata archaeon]|nr:DNA-directed DNA polymerase II small subunit [Thermoplasmata archaeon]